MNMLSDTVQKSEWTMISTGNTGMGAAATAATITDNNEEEEKMYYMDIIACSLHACFKSYVSLKSQLYIK